MKIDAITLLALAAALSTVISEKLMLEPNPLTKAYTENGAKVQVLGTSQTLLKTRPLEFDCISAFKECILCLENTKPLDYTRNHLQDLKLQTGQSISD